MAAMLKDVRVRGSDEPREVHMKLVAWGRWARCAMPGAEGTAVGYLRQRLDHAHEGEPTPEIELTDRAVARMKVLRPDYWGVFARYYLNPSELSEYEIAEETGRTMERVTAMLRQARILVAHHMHTLQSSVNLVK